MKKITISLITIILIFFLSFGLQSIQIILDRQDEKSSIDFEVKSSASESHEYEWYRIWEEIAFDIAVDSMDQVYVAGNTGGYEPNITLAKYDTTGNQLWNRIWGGDDSEYGRRVAIDSLDNVYLAGYTDDGGIEGKDMVLVKYDKNGVFQWNRTWDGGYDDKGWGVAVDFFDNVYLAGCAAIWDKGAFDTVLVKYDSSGNQLWNRTWGGESDDFCCDIALDSLNNIYLAGQGQSFGTGIDYDMFLAKYDSFGVFQWNVTWGGDGDDLGWTVAVDSLNNIYLAGQTNSFGAGYNDMVLAKYNSLGVQQWNRTWGGSGYDNCYGVAVDSLDNVYITGEMDGGTIVVLKFDSSGDQKWLIPFTLIGGQGEGIVLDSFDNIYIAARQILVKYSKIPEVTINYPYQNELFGSIAPTFDISILEPNLDTTWYTLDGGVTNISFSGQVGTIDQTEWNKQMSGEVTIQFYAQNSLTKVGYSEVVVVRDIDDPEIIINNPTPNQVFEDGTPTYDISVIEPNLDNMWYTLDNGVTNYTTTQFNGTINQNAWNAAPYGYITITFYAKDLVGNIGFNEVIIEKRQVIYGYPLLIFIGTIGIITVIYLKKKYK